MIDQINHTAEMWWAWMWPIFWQVGVLIGFVAVIDLLIRRRVWPQVRYALWLLVLAKLILPPTFSLSTSFTSGLEPLAEQIMSVGVESEEGTTLPYIDVSLAPIVIRQHGVQTEAEQPVAASEGPVTPTDRAASVVQTARLSARGWAMFVWLGGVAVLSVWLAARFRQLRRSYTAKGDGAVLPSWLSESVSESARKLRLRRLPRIIVSGDIASPAVFGVLRPTLLLPSRHLAKGLQKDTEHVLLHELAHIKRRDLWVHAVYMVLQIVHWFNPLLWLVRRRLQHLRELCCDASVAWVLRGDTSLYRQTILETARRLLARPVAPGMGLLGLFEDSSRLLIRLKWLEKKTWRYRTLRIVVILALIAFMSACVLPMAQGGPDVRVSAQELVAKIIASEKRIKDIQLHMTCTIPAHNRTFYEYDWGCESGKEFYSGIDNTRDSRTDVYRKVEVARAFDGAREWQFRNDPKSSRPNGGISEANPSFSFSGGIMTFNTLLGFDAKEPGRLSFGEAIDQAESISVRDEVEFIDGRPCYVIEAINLEAIPSGHRAYDVRAWIDCRRDYRPLKFEKYRSIPGKNRFKAISRRVDNVRLKEIDGIWLPIEGERTTFSTNDIDPPAGITAARFGTLPNEERLKLGVFNSTAIAATRRLEIDVESIRLNKGIPAKTFTISFPKGCEVYDEFKGIRYVIGEQSEKDAALSDSELIAQVKKLSVSDLIEILRSKGLGLNKRRLFAAIRCLFDVGSSAVPQLVAEIRQAETPITQSKLAFTLRAIGDVNAVPGLIDALERCGFSSDYGIGRVTSNLGRFYRMHQIDPAREGLGMGRPVREITVALEKLTGHTEGHDHFGAYDSAGNRLGGYTVTPEIRDRQRAHRRQVAERWRKWWQVNKGDIKPIQKAPTPPAAVKPPRAKAREGMVLAAPEGAELTLAVVPNIGDSPRKPSLTDEEYQEYVERLAEEGPYAGSIRGDSFQWSPIKGDAARFKGLPLSKYNDQTYILLCARAQYVMMPEVEGKWIWGLEKVEAASSVNGSPAISIRFDDKGAELLGELTKANIDNHLAIAVDSWVCAAPVVRAQIRRVATITGDFTAEEARALVEDLKKGMSIVDQEALEAMRQISQAAEELSRDQLPKMTPRQIVGNLFMIGLAGDSEKLAWFFRPESVAAKSITVDDFGRMADGHKIRVPEVHADANDALAVTSNIQGKSGDEEGRLVFYLSRQTGAWLIYDADIGDPQRIQDDVTRFKNKHPNAKPFPAKTTVPAVENSKTDKTGSAEKWRRVLPDGSEVKLVAVFRPKDDPVSFWDPDGNIIPGPRLGRWQYSNFAGSELAVVLEHPQNFDENPDPDGKFYSPYGWREIHSSKPLAALYYRGYGDWEDFGSLHQGSELSHLGQAYTLANVEDKTLLRHKQILVKMWYGVNPDIGIRLAAVDKEGKKYPMEAADIWLGGAPRGHRAMYFQFAEGLNKEELSHFILQKRPMALVRFSGFATEPKKAAVQAETEASSKKAGLIWGEAVNGLRAAIEFEPEKQSYSIPEKIDIRFHIQNVSDKPIQFISESYRPEALEIHDANGIRQQKRENYYSGLPAVTRHHLEPGREVVLPGLPLSIAQNEQQLENLGGPYGTDFKAKPGVYLVRAKLWISRFLTSGRSGDFKGALETGERRLVVADPAGRLTATGGKGSVVEIDPDAADILRRYWRSLEESDWDTALALCTEDVRKEAARHPSPEAFFRAVVPIVKVLIQRGRPRTGYWPNPPKYFAYIYDVRISQPGLPRDAFWVWKVRRLEGQEKWEIDFPAIAFESWLADEKDQIERAAKELEQRKKELAPKFEGASTALTAERNEFVIGEPICLNLQLVNQSASLLRYDDQQVAVNNSLTITDAKGRKVKYIAPLFQTMGASKRIEPGQTKMLFERFDITEQYAIKKPGQYRVQFSGRGLQVGVLAEDSAGPEDPTSFTPYPDKLPSNVVTITVRRMSDKQAGRITSRRGTFELNKQIPLDLDCPVVKDAWGNDRRPFRVESVKCVEKDGRLL